MYFAWKQRKPKKLNRLCLDSYSNSHSSDQQSSNNANHQLNQCTLDP